MSDVSIRDLRFHGGDVVDRVLAGECLTVTKAGKAVAELRPLPKSGLDAAALMQRWKNLPPIDPQALGEDIDTYIDAVL